MNQKIFKQIFWGWLLTFFEIHLIFMDLLPDPVGYGLVYAALEKAGESYKEALIPKRLALLMMVASIPDVFIGNPPVSEAMILSGWDVYMVLIGIAKLILVYYLFKWMLAVALRAEADELLQKTRGFFRVYMIVMLLIQAITPFLLNVTHYTQATFIGVLGITGGVLQIVLLVYFRKFSKLPDGEPGEN